jgi:hypothetical protein
MTDTTGTFTHTFDVTPEACPAAITAAYQRAPHDLHGQLTRLRDRDTKRFTAASGDDAAINRLTLEAWDSAARGDHHRAGACRDAACAITVMRNLCDCPTHTAYRAQQHLAMLLAGIGEQVWAATAGGLPAEDHTGVLTGEIVHTADGSRHTLRRVTVTWNAPHLTVDRHGAAPTVTLHALDPDQHQQWRAWRDRSAHGPDTPYIAGHVVTTDPGVLDTAGRIHDRITEAGHARRWPYPDLVRVCRALNLATITETQLTTITDQAGAWDGRLADLLASAI